MITLGIELSSQPQDTAACMIDWNDDGSAAISAPLISCDDAKLDLLIKQSQVIGIDSPLGWPQDFVEAVNHWDYAEWNTGIRDKMRFRHTDRFVASFFKNRKFRISPLSVSTDRIAMRAMALLKRHGVTDKSGDARFFEVYPAGSLAAWGIRHKGYKGNKADTRKHRNEILENLRQKLQLANINPDYAKTDHALDALVASITARIAVLKKTLIPNSSEQVLAKVEGWIHLPNRTLTSVNAFNVFCCKLRPNQKPYSSRPLHVQCQLDLPPENLSRFSSPRLQTNHPLRTFSPSAVVRLRHPRSIDLCFDYR